MRPADDQPGADFDAALLSSARTRELPPGSEELPLPPRGPPPELPPLVVPPRIGHFTILQQVGQGGMGIVHSAYDNQLDRKVAIKLLRSSSGDSLGRARLHREAQAMARLAHPNIVRVYEVGQLDDGHVYIVMEFVQGHTLRQWLRKARRPWREVLAVLLQAGRGLAAAHAAGLVHRDFKPDNILVADDGFVRVLDFGLARALEATDAAGTPAAPVSTASQSYTALSDQLTQAGTVIGTPAYMSPEQFGSDPIDARSDQFAYCVVAYEALYGGRPFSAAAADQLVAQIDALLAAEAPRGTGVPNRLRRAILGGLAADPEHRWPSVQALLDELSREPGKQARPWIAGGVIVALAVGLGLSLAPQGAAAVCQDGPARFAGVWHDARRAEVAAALRATGVAAADDVVRRVEQRLDDTRDRWVAMYTDACEATTVRGEQSAQLMDLRMACLHRHRTEVDLLLAGLTHADAAAAQRAVEATLGLAGLEPCADAPALLAEVPPPGDPETAAAVEAVRDRLARVKVTGSLGQFDEARALMAGIVEDAAALGYPPLRAEALVRQGDLTDLGGDAAAAEQLFADAFFIAGGVRHERVQAEAAVNLVYVIGAEQARYAEALAWDRHAEMLIDRLGQPVALQISRLNGLGTLMERWGKYAEGQRYLEQALALAEVDGEREPIRLATVLLNTGSMHLARSEFAVAEQRYTRALEIYERVLGPDNPHVPDCLNNLGQVAHLRADLDAAEAYFDRALASWERSLGPDHPRLTYPLENLGSVATARRDYATAFKHLDRARALVEAARGPDDPELAPPLGGLADLAAERGDYAEAERLGTRAVALIEANQGPAHPYLAQPLHALAEAALGQHQHAAARALFERGLELAEKTYGPDDLGVLAPLDGLGRVALAEGRPAAAVAPLERAAALMQKIPTRPVRRADTNFALARALWPAREHHARARALAEAARADYETSGPAFNKERDEVAAWLAAHPG